MSVFIPPKITTQVRMNLILQSGELVYDTDIKSLYVGDGNTLGGKKLSEVSGEDFSLILNETAECAAQAYNRATNAQETADEAKGMYSTLENLMNEELLKKQSAPNSNGTAGQVLTLDTDGVTPVWANPTGGSGGGGGLTKWSASGLETREIDTQYTATQDGYIIFNITGKLMANTYLRLIIDGVEVASSINYDPANVKPHGSSFLVPVFSGQTYILEYGSYIMGDYGWNLYFAPCV